MAATALLYINRDGHIGICTDPVLIDFYRQEYTHAEASPMDFRLALNGFTPRRFLVGVQVRRMFREQEAAA